MQLRHMLLPDEHNLLSPEVLCTPRVVYSLKVVYLVGESSALKGIHQGVSRFDSPLPMAETSSYAPENFL